MLEYLPYYREDNDCAVNDDDGVSMKPIEEIYVGGDVWGLAHSITEGAGAGVNVCIIVYAVIGRD